jgi:hypothetical protein
MPIERVDKLPALKAHWKYYFLKPGLAGQRSDDPRRDVVVELAIGSKTVN